MQRLSLVVIDYIIQQLYAYLLLVIIRLSWASLPFASTQWVSNGYGRVKSVRYIRAIHHIGYVLAR